MSSVALPRPRTCLEFFSIPPASSALRPTDDARKQMAGQQPVPTKSIPITPSYRSSNFFAKMAIENFFPNKWLVFTAASLLFFSCISGNAWSLVSFLNAEIDGRAISFGIFGCTGVSQPTFGYNVSQAVGPINQALDDYLGSPLLQSLEKALLMHLLLTILLYIVWAIMYFRRDVGKKAKILRGLKILLFFPSALATLALFLYDVGVFSTLMQQLRSNGIPAGLGNANWFTLGAVIALFIEPCWFHLERALPEDWQRRPTAMNSDGTGAALGVGPSLPTTMPTTMPTAISDLPASTPAVPAAPPTAAPPESPPRDILGNPSATSQTIQPPSRPSQPPNTTNPFTTPQMTAPEDAGNPSLTPQAYGTNVVQRQYSKYLPYRKSPTDPTVEQRLVARRQYSYYIPDKPLPPLPGPEIPDQPPTSRTTQPPSRPSKPPSRPSQPPTTTNPLTTPQITPPEAAGNPSLTPQAYGTNVVQRQYSKYLPYRKSPTDPTVEQRLVARRQYSYYIPNKPLPALPGPEIPDQPATSQTTQPSFRPSKPPSRPSRPEIPDQPATSRTTPPSDSESRHSIIPTTQPDAHPPG